MGNFRWLTKNSKNLDVNLSFFEDISIEENLDYNEEDLVKIAILDVETTGTDYKKDKIIELAFLLFDYDKKNNKVIRITDEYNELLDPKEPISKKITKITGITDEDVKDKEIDWNEVNNKLKNVDICICHNAKFDRSFFEKYSNILTGKIWLCSWSQIAWFDDYDFPVSKQEVLAYYHGFYYEGHRALTDCKALLNLLLKKAPDDENLTYLELLYRNYKKIDFMVIAQKTTYDKKPFFNENEFSWEPDLKLWYKNLPDQDESIELLQKLIEEVYSDKRASAEVIEVSPDKKFMPMEKLLKTIDLKTNYKESKEYVLLAKKTPYKINVKNKFDEVKEIATRHYFKLRGYDWYANDKIWYIYLDENELEEEKEWLRKKIYLSDFIGEVKKNRFFKK